MKHNSSIQEFYKLFNFTSSSTLKMSLEPLLNFNQLFCQFHPYELVTNFCNDGTFLFDAREMSDWTLCDMHMFSYINAWTTWNCASLSKYQRHIYFPS